MYRLLTINPGSTSTKVAVFEDLNCVFETAVLHHTGDLKKFSTVMDQFDMRRKCVLDALKKAGQSLDFAAVVGRGGLARAVASGTYEVTDKMIEEERNAEHQHACDLGCIIAKSIADDIPGCVSLVADPGTTDELAPEAKVSGLPELPRICIWHALNQKAIARRYAREHHTRYEDLNLIICHLGGGISVAAHKHGKAIDANNALDGEGPFSPERAGSLPAAALVSLCFSGKYTEQELRKIVSGHGGMIAHLGTKDMQKVIKMIENGDEHARLILNAMVWHTAKAIVSEGAVLCGPPDAILLTGGIAYNDYIVELLKQRIEWLAPVAVYPGENEMQALAENGLRYLFEHQKPSYISKK
jgi:butyrate kinase